MITTINTTTSMTDPNEARLAALVDLAMVQDKPLTKAGRLAVNRRIALKLHDENFLVRIAKSMHHYGEQRP